MKTYPKPSGFTDGTGRPITGGSWFHLRRWPTKLKPEEKGYELYSCFVWRLEESAGGRFTLVAYGEDKRLPLTHDRSRELIAFQPSDQFYFHEFPLEWGRWLESGIGVYLSGDWQHLGLNTHWENGYGGGSIKFETGMRRDRERDKQEVKEWLMNLLYGYVHPRIAERIEAEQGEEGVKAAAKEFVAEMEKREVQGLSSLPPKRKR